MKKATVLNPDYYFLLFTLQAVDDLDAYVRWLAKQEKAFQYSKKILENPGDLVTACQWLAKVKVSHKLKATRIFEHTILLHGINYLALIIFLGENSKRGISPSRKGSEDSR